MAISAGDWSSTTDPFIHALTHAWTGTLGDLTNNRILLYNSEGFINGIVDEKDIQELYWSRDSDKENSWPVIAFGVPSSGPGVGYYEFGGFNERIGSSFITFASKDIIPVGTPTAYVYTTGKSSGSALYSLFAFTAYAWEQKDPAQIIFSWIAHWVDSIWTLKDHIDQTSFQDASGYYDENPCPLSLWREVGLSIAGQIKKVMDHTSDFLVVAPADITGDVLMALKTKRSGITTRATAIDLESASVKSYTIRPTDRYTLDRLNSTFGSIIMAKGGIADEPSEYITARPIEFPSENRNKSMQKVGDADADRTVDIDSPYHLRRRHLLNHVDIGFWKEDQDELEIEFADLTHLNFEAGDIVPVIGKGYDGTELFLVTEKIPNWDTMLCSCRLLMLRGVSGKPPVYADESNLLLSLRPNSLGLFFDGDISLPVSVPIADDPRNFDRLWGEAGYSHASEHTRGTVGPGLGPPVIWPLNVNKRERWPGFALATDTGLEISSDLTAGKAGIVSSAGNYTFYWIGNPADAANYRVLFEVDDGGTDNIIIAHSGSGTPGKVQFFDGIWHGTANSATGWQILVFVLDSGGASIRRNGSVIESGLSYTQRAMAAADDYGLGVNAAGTTGVFEGDWMECALFEGAHSTATIEAIEAHLAEKYNITI